MQRLMPLEDELELIPRLAARDIDARNRLVENCSHLISYYGKEFSRILRMSEDDLRQSLYLQLIKEAFDYRFEPGKRFIAFARMICLFHAKSLYRDGNRLKRNEPPRECFEFIEHDLTYTENNTFFDFNMFVDKANRIPKKLRTIFLARIDWENVDVRTMPEAASLLQMKLANYNRQYYIALNYLKTSISHDRVDYPYDLTTKEYLTREAESRRHDNAKAVLSA